MDKIIQFKQFNLEKIKKKYELEGCDDELVELAEKIAKCNPAGRVDKKKDALKSEYLKKAADYRVSLHSQETSSYNELSDDELDAAAGGLLAREDIEELRKKKNELKQD